MVSTHLKNISQIGSSPQVGVKITNDWNHHLDNYLKIIHLPPLYCKPKNGPFSSSIPRWGKPGTSFFWGWPWVSGCFSGASHSRIPSNNKRQFDPPSHVEADLDARTGSCCPCQMTSIFLKGLFRLFTMFHLKNSPQKQDRHIGDVEFINPTHLYQSTFFFWGISEFSRVQVYPIYFIQQWLWNQPSRMTSP